MCPSGPALASHDKTERVTTDDDGVYFGEIKSVQYATVATNCFSKSGEDAREYNRR